MVFGSKNRRESKGRLYPKVEGKVKESKEEKMEKKEKDWIFVWIVKFYGENENVDCLINLDLLRRRKGGERKEENIEKYDLSIISLLLYKKLFIFI